MVEGRITHDYMDIGGRAKQDARAEGAVIEMPSEKRNGLRSRSDRAGTASARSDVLKS
jgi:hypothetical protein